MTKIIDGVKLAAELEQQLKIKADELINLGVKPCLGIIVFADDPSGAVYTRLKAEAAARLGIKIVTSNTDSVLDKWNRDKSIHGILIQRPGYRGEEFEKYWEELVLKIEPKKDVDGLRPASPAGRPDSKFEPATVMAVEKILDYANSTRDRGRQQYMVVGRGMIARQLAIRFQVTEVSSRDKNLPDKINQADVVIAASGRSGLIKTVKPGAMVIDVGWPKGDVDFNAVKDIAGVITPVPGGVGPVTVVCLLENLIEAVYNQEILNPKS